MEIKKLEKKRLDRKKSKLKKLLNIQQFEEYKNKNNNFYLYLFIFIIIVIIIILAIVIYFIYVKKDKEDNKDNTGNKKPICTLVEDIDCNDDEYLYRDGNFCECRKCETPTCQDSQEVNISKTGCRENNGKYTCKDKSKNNTNNSSKKKPNIGAIIGGVIGGIVIIGCIIYFGRKYNKKENNAKPPLGELLVGHFPV